MFVFGLILPPQNEQLSIYICPLSKVCMYGISFVPDFPEILHLFDDNDDATDDNVFLIPKPLTN